MRGCTVKWRRMRARLRASGMAGGLECGVGAAHGRGRARVRNWGHTCNPRTTAGAHEARSELRGSHTHRAPPRWPGAGASTCWLGLPWSHHTAAWTAARGGRVVGALAATCADACACIARRARTRPARRARAQLCAQAWRASMCVRGKQPPCPVRVWRTPQGGGRCRTPRSVRAPPPPPTQAGGPAPRHGCCSPIAMPPLPCPAQPALPLWVGAAPGARGSCPPATPPAHLRLLMRQRHGHGRPVVHRGHAGKYIWLLAKATVCNYLQTPMAQCSNISRAGCS